MSRSGGTQPPCAKCAGGDIGVTYHKQGCPKDDCSCANCAYGSHQKQHTEHLHFTCRRCHYDWVGPVAGEDIQ